MPKKKIQDTLKIPDFAIETLGHAMYDSPLRDSMEGDICKTGFIDDSRRIVYDDSISCIKQFLSLGIDPPSMEVAGPRKKIYFNPSNSRAVIVTAGGLCPGLNDVVRALFNEMHYLYRVKEVIGIRYGLAGLVPRVGQPPITINPELVENIHRNGGSFLGSSRGPQNSGEIVDFLERERISIFSPSAATAPSARRSTSPKKSSGANSKFRSSASPRQSITTLVLSNAHSVFKPQ